MTSIMGLACDLVYEGHDETARVDEHHAENVDHGEHALPPGFAFKLSRYAHSPESTQARGNHFGDVPQRPTGKRLSASGESSELSESTSRSAVKVPR